MKNDCYLGYPDWIPNFFLLVDSISWLKISTSCHLSLVVSVFFWLPARHSLRQRRNEPWSCGVVGGNPLRGVTLPKFIIATAKWSRRYIFQGLWSLLVEFPTHIPPWEEENYLQRCLGMGIVCSQEGTSGSVPPTLFLHLYELKHMWLLKVWYIPENVWGRLP